jgi:hypothetical protein
MTIDSRKLYFVFIGVLVLLGIGFIVSIHEANALLEGRSKVLVHLKVQSKSMADQQTLLNEDKKDIAKYADLNTIAQTVVPQDKNQAEAVREIVDLAAQSGIPRLDSIAFPPSTLGGSIPTKGITQVTAVKGIPGVYDLQITVTQSSSDDVSYSNFVTFLSKLEQNRRTAEVGSINVQPNDASPNLISFTLVIDEFIKP